MNTRALTKRMRGGLILAVTAGLAIAGATGMAVAARGARTARVKQALAPVGAGNARGKVVLAVRSVKKHLDGSFNVGVRHLKRNGQFQVLVQGVKIGGLSTNGGGNGRARFRTKPRGRALVLGIDPRGKQIVVRDDEGNDVLEGDCPDDPADAGKVACCVPPESGDGAFTHGDEGDGDNGDGDHGDGEHEDNCELLTVDECAMVGGSSVGGSCLPDPCTSTPPVSNGTACCIPQSDDDDGEGAECEALTPDHCAAEGGTMISATGCDPNPCEPTPSTDPRVVCCGAGEDSGECEHRTAMECDAHHGTNMGPGSCHPNPCGGDGGDGGHGEGGDN